FSAEDGVVSIAFQPAIGVPGTVFVVIRISGLRFGRNGVGLQFFPFVQLVIESDGHGVTLIDLMITHGRAALLVDKTVAAEHAGRKPGGMVPPMKQIGAGHMPPVMTAFILKDVKEVITSFPEDGAVRVEGHGLAFRDNKMVSRPVW